VTRCGKWLFVARDPHHLLKVDLQTGVEVDCLELPRSVLAQQPCLLATKKRLFLAFSALEASRSAFTATFLKLLTARGFSQLDSLVLKTACFSRADEDHLSLNEANGEIRSSSPATNLFPKSARFAAIDPTLTRSGRPHYRNPEADPFYDSDQDSDSGSPEDSTHRRASCPTAANRVVQMVHRPRVCGVEVLVVLHEFERVHVVAVCRDKLFHARSHLSDHCSSSSPGRLAAATVLPRSGDLLFVAEMQFAPSLQFFFKLKFGQTQ